MASPVGAWVGSKVGFGCVGTAVGIKVGWWVGAAVGIRVGWWVGACVGFSVGVSVNIRGSKFEGVGWKVIADGVGWRVIAEGVGCNVNELGVGCNVKADGVGGFVNSFFVGSIVGWWVADTYDIYAKHINNMNENLIIIIIINYNKL